MTLFDSARDLLDWACEDIVDFDAAVETFLDLKPYEVIGEFDAKAGHNVIKVRFATVPASLRKLASHAVWDLKHALDHAMWAAITLVRGRPAGDVHFLWSSHPNDLKSRLAATSKRNPDGKYPPELWDFIQGLEPYPSGDGYSGGSDELIAFSKMANSTKHAVALVAAPRARVTHMETQSPIVRAYLDHWDSSKQELTIGHVPVSAKVNMKLQFATNVTFGDVELFQDHPAGLVMEQIARAISDIIDALECEVCAILAHQGRS